MTPQNARLLRLLWALLVGVGFGLSQMEVFIPEAHDGDAALVTSATDTAPNIPSAPTHDTSAPHICHCVHAHGIVMLTAGPALSLLAFESESIPFSIAELHSISSIPPLRPPIA
ncbi:MAG: hypothetical protein AB1762_16160 [Gemmatimonadota bacterium]